MNKYLFYFDLSDGELKDFLGQEDFPHCTLCYFSTDESLESFLLDFIAKNPIYILAKIDYFDDFDGVSVLKISSKKLSFFHKRLLVYLRNYLNLEVYLTYFGDNYSPHISFYKSRISESILGKEFVLSKLSLMRIKYNSKTQEKIKTIIS